MSSPVGQFVLGFAIAFSPAPVVGFATWTVVNAEDASPAPEVRAEPGYGSPAGREWSENPVVIYDESGMPVDTDQTQQDAAPQQEMEIETDCAKRKRKPIQKRHKPEREIPDL